MKGQITFTLASYSAAKLHCGNSSVPYLTVTYVTIWQKSNLKYVQNKQKKNKKIIASIDFDEPVVLLELLPSRFAYLCRFIHANTN